MKRNLSVVLLLFSFFLLVVAPTQSLATSAKSSQEAVQKLAAKVDINTADIDQLMTVPGIGPKTAEAIIAYRKANGAFASLDDLTNVKGIGPKKLAKMKPFLKK